MPADWPRSLKKTKMTQQAKLARLRNVQYIAADKGQLISKCLFWSLQFSPKTNENNSSLGSIVLKSNCFRSFGGRIEDTKKDISKLTELYLQQYIARCAAWQA